MKRIRAFSFVLQALFSCAVVSVGQASPQLNLLPVPSSVKLGTGQLLIDKSFSVALDDFRDQGLADAVDRFLLQVSRQTGIPTAASRTQTKDTRPTLIIRARHGRETTQELGEDESYQLRVTQAGAELTAPNPLGVLHGLQTFLQLIEPTPSGFAAPEVTITDAPRFPWRGLLIDVCRHFMPLKVLERNVDAMAAVKLNVLHLHLSDNEGFRVESKKFSRLTGEGSGGLYYTQAEMRRFIAYAHARGIRVVPEFDMPGHSRSWFLGYPELASGPGPYTLVSSADPVMDPTQETTYKFLNKFIGEMSALFPDAYFHIGGDEVDGEQWNANPKIQNFVRAHGMKNNQDLQAYFNQRLQKIVSKHHKIMMGWDEVLHPALPKSIVVQSWRGQQSLALAAREGYRGLLSYGYYLDLMWPASRHYAVDPLSGDAATLTPEEKDRILGGEACLWTELVTPENVDNRIWPRLGAIAERLWSPAEVQDPQSMYRRLDELSWHLELLGLTQRTGEIQMLHRMLARNDISSLELLADAVEPVKDYIRLETVKINDSSVPLNHLVDAVSPESDVARNFRALVESYIKSGYKDRTAGLQIRERLIRWQENSAILHPALEESFLLHEAEPLSDDLSSVAAVGVAALDYLEKSEVPPETWRTQQLSVLASARTAKAMLLLMIVDPVQELVLATAGST